MKSYKYILAVMAGAAFAAPCFQSCVSEEPFGGDGALRVKMVINSDITRAETDDIDLGQTTVLYISNSKGIVRKYLGLNTIPDRIPLRGGSYLAEAWAGDSVSASFDKKFYQGQTDFEINGNDVDVTVTCKIANVVTSINTATLEGVDVTDLKVVMGHSRGTLTFADETLESKGYFMMPNADKNLTYTITGVNGDGEEFFHDGVIPGVKKGHEYVLNVSNNPTYDEIGGSFLLVTIDEHEVLVESEVAILGCPIVSGVEFDASKQIFALGGQFTDKVFKVKAFGNLTHLYLSSEQADVLGLPASQLDLVALSETVANQLRDAGIDWEVIPNSANNTVTAYLHLKEKFLNSLPDGAYEMTLTPHDSYGKYKAHSIRIGVGEGYQIFEDPIILDPVAQINLLDLRARKAVVTGIIANAEATGMELQYRESGTSTWSSASLENVAAARRRVASKAAAGQKFSVTLSNLKPATRYEYRAVADEFTSESLFFTTESIFAIPNASFEDWSTYSATTLLGKKNVIFPGTGTEPTFWDSGNEGAATANMTLTNKSSDMFNSGTYSARLGSSKAMGIIAAGNIFTGDYVKTDGTNGILTFGRAYNGSHPDKVAVWANYRPGSVDIVKSGNEQYIEIASGENDHGQIYVALVTAPIEIRTNPNNRKLFPMKSTDEDFDKVVAYGQVSWKEAFGPDGSLQLVEVPLQYNDCAATTKPLYLVIVCSASKFGDYFSGSSSSVLYVDDFELIYE